VTLLSDKLDYGHRHGILLITNELISVTKVQTYGKSQASLKSRRGINDGHKG